MTRDSTQDTQYASFKQRHPYIEAFIEGIPSKALPVYIGLAVVFVWLAGLTLAVVNQHGGSTDAAQRLLEYMGALSLVYMIGFPALFGLTNVLNRWLEYRRGDV